MWKACSLTLWVGLTVVACESPPDPVAPMPWLYGFSATAIADSSSRDHAVATADGSPYGGLVIDAWGGGGERYTVVASIRGGVALRDGSGNVVASASGFEDVGTADDIEAIAVGDAQLGAPVIALATTLGGHREATTSLSLYQPATAGRLAVLFDEPIESRSGDAVVTGAVVVLPRALLYRSPEGESSLWMFDGARHRYECLFAFRPARDVEPREVNPSQSGV